MALWRWKNYWGILWEVTADFLKFDEEAKLLMRNPAFSIGLRCSRSIGLLCSRMFPLRVQVFRFAFSSFAFEWSDRIEGRAIWGLTHNSLNFSLPEWGRNAKVLRPRASRREFSTYRFAGENPWFRINLALAECADFAQGQKWRFWIQNWLLSPNVQSANEVNLPLKIYEFKHHIWLLLFR